MSNLTMVLAAPIVAANLIGLYLVARALVSRRRTKTEPNTNEPSIDHWIDTVERLEEDGRMTTGDESPLAALLCRTRDAAAPLSSER